VKKIILAVLATVFVSAQAYAFSGTITFGGTVVQHTNKKGITTNHFVANWFTDSIPPNTGAYAGVPGGLSTVMTSFSFTGNNGAPGTQVLLGAPITPQWTFTYLGVTYSFDLSAITSASNVLGSIAETGTGTAHITGLPDNTSATWGLTGSLLNGFTFSAHITTGAPGVPDGGSAVALLGIALAGIEGARRVIRARKA
jgi:hypothetical protein